MTRDILSVARTPRPMPAWKINVYRHCRLWHGYLSAFAFLALMFFSATGILLNHPDWIRPADSQPVETHFTVAHGDISAALKAADPALALSASVQHQGGLHGVYSSGDVDGDEAQLRYEGVSGNTSVTLETKTGAADASFRKADAVTIINDLHRGKNAGKAWKLLIDISAGIFLALSLVGYILFFSLRHRLRQTLILTAASLAALAGIFYWLVP
jgi:hypothetical protein